MHRRPSRAEALHALGLPPWADMTEVRRAYRRLARRHHPDVGGDHDTFAALHAAYEHLLEVGVAPVTAPARGRPSRGAAATASPATDLAAVDWELAVPDRPATLHRDLVAVWLALPSAGPVRPLAASSRAPGSRWNRLAVHLSTDLTARLRVAAALDQRGRAAVGFELTAAPRRSRRCLDRARLEGRWVRTRGSASTTLRATMLAGQDRRETALLAADHLGGFLEHIGWPLGEWTLAPAGG